MLPLICAILLTLAVGGIPARCQPSDRKPISRQGFLKAVEIGGLTSEELANLIREHGVEFRLSGEDRALLEKARVDNAVVEAIEASYRESSGAPSPAPQVVSQLVSQLVSQQGSGPRLTRDSLIGLIKQGHPSEALEQIVEMRGIDFPVTPEAAKEVEAAGGRRELLGAMILRQPPPPTAPAGPAPEPRNPPARAVSTPEPTAPEPVPSQSAVPSVPPPAREAVAASAEHPIQVDPAVQAVRLLRRVTPEYPQAARRDRVGGTVKLEVLVGQDGRVKKCRTLGGHPYLAAAAEAAVRRWSYLPAVVDGRAVPVVTQVELQFRLDSR